MVKIDFVNAQEPAINDINLNQMQLNIENAINAQVAGDTLPVGSIMPFGSDTVPENWLLCDGQAVSRTEYDLLFSIIGTSYGVGDGSTTFNLPNLKGRVAVGKDSTQTEFDVLGETGGEKTHTLTVEEMPSHSHTLKTSAETGTHDNGFIHNGSYTLSSQSSTTENAGGGQAHNILQPYQVTNYIIKARQSSGVIATVVDGLNSTSTTDALSANQGRILNEKTKKEVATAYISSGIDLEEGMIPLGLINSNTNKLTLLNGYVRIGAGISKVLVSGNVFANAKSDNTGYTWTQIMKNNTAISISINSNNVWFTSTVHSPILVDVQEGDLFLLYKLDSNNSGIRADQNTYLTVEVVE